MRRARSRLSAIAFALVGFMSVLLVSSVWSQESSPEPQGGVEAAASLDCPSGDLIYNRLPALRVEGVIPQGAATQSAAIAKLTEELRVRVSPSAFSMNAAADSVEQYVYENNGERKATLLTFNYGNGWIADSFSACNSSLMNWSDDK